MGMFDYVKVDYPLEIIEFDEQTIDPNQQENFQTKAFENALQTYTISEDGRLSVENHDILFHGILYFYTTITIDENNYWLEYHAKFTDGALVELHSDIVEIL